MSGPNFEAVLKSLGPDFFLSLHTAAPVAGGSQSEHEVDYPGYRRVKVERSPEAWRVHDGWCWNRQPVVWPAWPADVVGDLLNVTHAAVGADGLVVVGVTLTIPFVLAGGTAPMFPAESLRIAGTSGPPPPVGCDVLEGYAIAADPADPPPIGFHLEERYFRLGEALGNFGEALRAVGDAATEAALEFDRLGRAIGKADREGPDLPAS